MYRLFSRITGGLDPVAAAFRKHVEAHGMTLVRDAEAAAVAKKEAGALASSPGRRHRRTSSPGFQVHIVVSSFCPSRHRGGGGGEAAG